MQHLAAIVEPFALTFELARSPSTGALSHDSHRALQDARSAGLSPFNSSRNGAPGRGFLYHLCSFRGKSLDPIFDLFEYLIGDSTQFPSDWPLDNELARACLPETPIRFRDSRIPPEVKSPTHVRADSATSRLRSVQRLHLHEAFDFRGDAGIPEANRSFRQACASEFHCQVASRMETESSRR